MGNRIILIGASLGGVEALRELVAALPRDLGAPVLVVLHIGARSSRLPEILRRVSALPVKHANDGDALERGHIYIAPPDHHLLVDQGVARLSRGPYECRTRPAVDPLFRSAALAYGPNAVGVVLTGMGDDGTAGLLAIEDCGGTTIAQDPGEAIAPSMPRSAVTHVRLDHCCRLPRLAAVLTAIAADAPDDGPITRSLMLSVEAHIAAGTATPADWMLLVGSTSETRHPCPLCGLPLRDLGDPRFVRFRCEAGHALSAQHLQSHAAAPDAVPWTSAAWLPGRSV